MRKLKLLLTVCALFGVTTVSWGFEKQKYLIKNVGSGLYWGASNSWGTQASLVPSAAYLTLVPQEGGTYYIESQVNNGEGISYYFNGSYMDNDKPVKLTITEVSAGLGLYTIANGDTYYGYDGSSTVLGNLNSGASENAQWTIVSLEDAITALSNATAASPMDATFFIEDQNFGRNNRYFSNWVVTSGGGDAKKAGPNENMNWQQWNATCDIRQSISNLPNGIYSLKAQGFYRPGGNGTGSTDQNATLYAGTKSVAIALVSSTHSTAADNGKGLTTKNTNEGSEYYVPNSQDDASKAFVAGLYENELTDIIVTDGTLTIGAKNVGTVGDQWLVIDNFRLTYYGPLDLSTYKQALEDAIAAAEAINQSDKMSNKALSDLQKAIQDYKGQTYTSDTDYQTAIDAVNDAIKGAETSIKSYKIIATGSIPDNSLDGWVCENTNTFHINTWSVEGNSDGSEMKTPFIENWVGKGSYLGAGRVYYKLEGLNPGEEFYAQALVRSYNEANKDAPNGPNFFINDNEVDLTEAGTTFVFKNDNNEMSGIYATLGGQATIGDDGTLTLGVTIAENRNYNWVAFKSVFIQSMTDALAKAIKDAEALEGKIPDAAYSDLSSIVSSHNNATVDDIKAINDATKKYSAFVVPYVAFKNLKDNADQVAAAGTDDETGRNTLLSVISTQNNKVIAEKESADVITTATATLKEELTTYVTNANPVGEGEKFNMTFMLTNPDLTGLPTWQKADGWYTDQKSGNSQVMTNGNATSQDGTKTAFFEYWSNPPMGNNLFALYQKVNLPKGTYNMSCYAFAQYEQEGKHENRPNGVYFYANDVQGSAVNNARLSEQSIAFVTGKAQEVKIGLKPVGGNGNTWMGIGYVQLFKVPINKIDLDEDMAYEPENVAGDVTLKKRVYSGWNTIVLPFGMPEDIFTEQFGGGQLYKYTGDKNGVLQFAEATAIEPHIPYLFNSYAGDGSRKTIFLEAVTVSTGTPITAGTNFDFVGTYAPINRAITESDYLLVPGKFQKGNGRNSLNAYRAYIRGKVESEARELLISIDGVTTAIEAVDGKSVDSNSPIYNLAGQRVKSAQKGLYIQGGKKFVK